MILCLDVGNSHLFGGIFHKNTIQLRFRYDSNYGGTSDQLGIFLKTVLRENQIDPAQIKNIAICSVVPYLDYSLKSACKKYFSIEPFILQAGAKTGLKIKYHNPLEVGADRIANAIGAATRFPNKNILVADLGTATTCDAISASKEYRGGAIMAGMRISMEALQNNTAKLSAVEILRPEMPIGRSTVESIQAGLYYGQLGAIREFISKAKREIFNNQPLIVVGTGGFSHLFEQEKIFDIIVADLVLEGLHQILLLNLNTERKQKNATIT